MVEEPLPEEAAAAPITAQVDPTVRRFYELLPEVLAQELEVQRFERKSLGAEDLESLAGHRRLRRLRIDEDATHFRTRAARITLRPRLLPSADDMRAAVDAGRPLDALELAALSALQSVYPHVAEPRTLELIAQFNREFLKEFEWRKRDDAVRLRDQLLDELARYEEAVGRGWRILDDELDRAEIEALLEELAQLAPEARIGAGNLTELLLEDAVVREQVLEEMQTELAAVPFGFVPEAPEAELRERLAEAQGALMKQSGLVELLLEDAALAEEAAGIETALADQGVKAPDDEQRRELVSRRAEIELRRKQIKAEWRNTPPAQPFADEYMDAQDALLRRRLAALGARGALFAARYDALQRERAEIDAEIPAHTWDFLLAQADLSEAALDAVPPPDPLAGLDLGDRVLLDPATRAKQQQLINLLKQAGLAGGGDASAQGLLPKPQKGGGKPSGKKKPPPR